MKAPALLGALLASGVVLAACGGGAAAIPVVSVAAADFSFALPDTISGGLTRLQLKNTGKESHHAQFVRLNDGVTVQQFQSTLQGALQAAATEGPAALGRVFALVTFTGGPAPIGPGGTSEAVANLAAGQYLLLCFIPSPDGVPHLAKGMIKPLTVSAGPAKPPAEPSAKGTVSLGDFAFVGLPSLSSGKATLKVTNIGKEPHEMGVLRLKGVPAAQLKQMLTAPPPPAGAAPPAGPPPYEDAGGLQAIMPGATAWATLDLKPGDYAVVCFVPSGANRGAPHVALGMFSSFTVK
ncbi:MAG: hypothetical protein HY330_03680 [Chloroflexi bacterium]|nr:hypothetical protein [Chloroflexota bacterium]